jgi:ATP-dependent helicase/nuclease subunit B
MQPFLEQLAGQLFEEYGENISRLCIVFPNRRAGLFMRQYISRLIDKPIWLPDIYALEDFVVLKSHLTVPDQLTLLVKLYRVHQSIDKLKARPFAEFMSWGNILLSDFDEIDQYLADGKQVFSYLDELKALNEWNPDGTPLTEFEKNYLQFYNSLADIYGKFKETLLGNREGYFGLAFTQLISKLDTESFAEWDKVIFAGFNALTIAEEKLFSHLISVGKGQIFWDADDYYLSDSRQEAGRFLRTYQKSGKFGEMSWIGRSFHSGAKKISVIGVPGNVGQAKLAGQLTSEMMQEIDPSDIALVLVDEGLMLPVLNSIPPELEHFNVTMGYPMKLTPVYTLFDALFKLFVNAHKNGRKAVDSSGNEFQVLRFHYKDIDRFFSHPYIVEIIVQQVGYQGNPMPRLEKSYFNREEVLGLMKRQVPSLYEIFSTILMTDKVLPVHLSQFFSELINFFRSFYLKKESEGNSSHSIDFEYLYHFSLLLERIKGLISDSDLLQDLSVLYEIFTAQVAGMRLPFYGEPLKGLQLMGMLETRALDFKNIIMLSVNEGQLPKGKHKNTFLPDEVRTQYSLPRYNERNAVFGYHFYRLLQRAELIYLLYNTEGNELGGGEKSRFITQIINELPAYNNNISIKENILCIPPPGQKELPILIQKDKEVLERLKEIAEKGFSPTALGRYLACTLQFCFSQVMGISEPDLVEESIDAATLGEVVHKVLHNTYKPYIGKTILQADIDNILPVAIGEVKKVFMSDYSTTDMDTGKNLLILKVAEKMVRRFLTAEKAYLEKLASKSEGIEILQLEQPLEANVLVQDEKTGELFKVKVHGKADRIDRTGGVTRVIDYKTGQVKNPEVKLDEISQLPEHDNPAKILQLLAYAWMYRRMHPVPKGSPIEMVSGIVSLRMASRYLINASIGKEEMFTEEHLSSFEELLSTMFSEIFNPEIPFKQAENADVCINCTYQKICNRVIN